MALRPDRPESFFRQEIWASYIRFVATLIILLHDWADSENRHRRRLGELRNGAKTKAGPLEAEQLSSRLGHIALVR